MQPHERFPWAYSPRTLIALLSGVTGGGQATEDVLGDFSVHENAIRLPLEQKLLCSIRLVPVQGVSPPKIIVESDKLVKIDIATDAPADELVMCGQGLEQIDFGFEV